MYPTPVPAMVVPQNPHPAPVGRIRPPAAVAVPNRIEISDVNGLRGELDKFNPYDDSELRGKVEALEAKSEKDPQFGAWKTDVLPGLLAGKADAALVDARAADTDKRVAVGEGADASGASAETSPEHPMRAVAVGFDAKATGPVATSVGEETRATADSSAAFGSKAESTALGAVQLGNGVNTTERSLQFRGANLFVVATRDTKVAKLGTGFPYTASVVDSGAVLPTSKAVKDFVEGKGYLTSFKETDPEFAKWRSSTCLSAGFGAKVGTQANTAVGNSAEATGNSSSAFGTQAKATATGAMQLGLGTNATDWTLQFRGANLFRVESSKTSVATLGAGFPKASKNVFGAMKVGDNLSVADGVVSAVVPTKTSQLDNDSNFASDVLDRTCIHSFGTEAVPPIDGVRVSAYEWRFNYDMPGVPAHYILFSDGTWEIGSFNPYGERMPMSEVEAPFDVDSLDFGGFGSVAFSGADDMVARESRLPKKTSQLENDSGFLTSVPVQTRIAKDGLWIAGDGSAMARTVANSHVDQAVQVQFSSWHPIGIPVLVMVPSPDGGSLVDYRNGYRMEFVCGAHPYWHSPNLNIHEPYNYDCSYENGPDGTWRFVIRGVYDPGTGNTFDLHTDWFPDDQYLESYIYLTGSANLMTADGEIVDTLYLSEFPYTDISLLQIDEASGDERSVAYASFDGTTDLSNLEYLYLPLFTLHDTDESVEVSTSVVSGNYGPPEETIDQASVLFDSSVGPVVAPATHTHSASDVVAGVFPVDMVPDIPASKVTDTLQAYQIPGLPASKITSGEFAANRIPSLAASKITSGTFAADRIPSLAASKITSGTFDTARIPSLAASKITSGTFDPARIPSYAEKTGLTMSARSVMTVTTSGQVSFPAKTNGQARDIVVFYTHPSSGSISFPTNVNYLAPEGGKLPSEWEFTPGEKYLMTFTDLGSYMLSTCTHLVSQ